MPMPRNKLKQFTYLLDTIFIYFIELQDGIKIKIRKSSPGKKNCDMLC